MKTICAAVGRVGRVEIVALGRGQRLRLASVRGDTLDVAAARRPRHVGDRLAVGRPGRHEFAFVSAWAGELPVRAVNNRGVPLGRSIR